MLLLMMLLKQHNKIKSLQNDSKIYRDILTNFDIGFCFVDMQNRTEMIFFKSVYSMNELYYLIENSDELKDYCSLASNSSKVFSLTLKMKESRKYVKCRVKSVVNEKDGKIKGLMLIFEDISESVKLNTKTQAHTQNILENKQYYMGILDRLPYLVWEYDLQNLKIIYSNKLYSQYFRDKCIQVNLKKESINKRLSIEGELKILMINSIKKEKSVVNFAHDATELIQARKSIGELHDNRKNIMSHVNTAISFYDKNTRIKLYNNAFANLFDIDKQWLNDEPLYVKIWQKLSLLGKVLENNFLLNSEFLKNIVNMYQFVMYLSETQPIYVTIIPEMDCGFWFIYEEVKCQS
ncbi:MAG: hypothetical protein HRK26_04315 [Rickettsiaceae bacterium H1]|nr:hypothetical protein [Rickettsiaceae bacterium H1]